MLLEAYLYIRYAAVGAEYHFWLHGLIGGIIGVSILTAWRLLRASRGKTFRPWEAGALGHIYSAVPDILFITTGMLHMYWMDIFGLHISVHYIPYPILTLIGLGVLTSVSYMLAVRHHTGWSVRCLVLLLVYAFLAFSFRQPLPDSYEALTTFDAHQSVLCPFAGYSDK